MNRFDFRFRTLHLSTALLLLAGCPNDGEGDEDSDTEGDTETPSTSSPSTSSPSTSSPSTSSPSTSATETDPTDTDPTDTDTDPSDTDESSSSGEPVVCEVTPGEWAAPNWDKNTVAEQTARAALFNLTGAPLMDGAEDGAVVVDSVDDLTAAYMAGDPNLASITNPGYQSILDMSFVEFVEVIAAGEQELADFEPMVTWTPGEEGGIWGTSNRGVNEGGLEVRQLVDKGLFAGGGFYYHATLLTEGDIDEATIDRIAYIWGNDAALDPVDKKTPLDDGASYSYAQGFHALMAAELTNAKAYAADPMCEAERDAALQEFFRLWETSMVSRFVHYMQVANEEILAATNGTGLAAAIHELSEGIGLVVGYYGLPAPASGPLSGGSRVITDADIDLIATALGVDLADLGASTTGLFVESLPNYETAQEAAEGVVMDVYGVDAATLAAWRAPTPG
jgi:hypothetical protein